MTIPADKLQEILDGAAKATPGPWALTEGNAGEWNVDATGTDDWAIAVVCGGAGHEDPNGRSDENARLIAACDPQTITSLILELLDSRSTIEAINARLKEVEGERDEAQSAVTAWQQVFGTIEAHLMDRVNMKDEANPQRCLDIIRYDVAHVDEASKRIVASRWHDYNAHEKRIAVLEARAEADERELAAMSESEWRDISTAPSLDRVIVAGWQAPLGFNGRVLVYYEGHD